MKILVKILETDRDFGLEIELLAGAAGLSREISNVRAQKPGLAIAGHLESVRPECVQVLGATEMTYLQGLSAGDRAAAVEGLMRVPAIACVVLTSQIEPPSHLLAVAERYGVSVFRSQLPTEPFINRLHGLLDEYLSPEISVHGVIMDVFGVGVLLTGQSGIGKSESALDLVLRGHRLVADDAANLKSYGAQLVGTGSPLTRHHMELRGLGIINVKDLFGAAAVRERKRIELIVEMVDWQDGLNVERLGIDDLTEEVLGIAVHKIILPIRPGRNVASIIEVAARNHLLKVQGHHSAREFKETLERRLAETGRRPVPGSE